MAAGIDNRMGALLMGLEQEAAASRAGLLSGDVVVRLDGKSVGGVDDLIRLLDRDLVGQTVEIDVLRLGRMKTFRLVPSERKAL